MKHSSEKEHDMIRPAPAAPRRRARHALDRPQALAGATARQSPGSSTEWDAVRFLVGEVALGGQLDDFWDRVPTAPLHHRCWALAAARFRMLHQSTRGNARNRKSPPAQGGSVTGLPRGQRVLTEYLRLCTAPGFLGHRAAALCGLSAPDSAEMGEHLFCADMLPVARLPPPPPPPYCYQYLCLHRTLPLCCASSFTRGRARRAPSRCASGCATRVKLLRASLAPQARDAGALGLLPELDGAVVVERSREAIRLLVSQASEWLHDPDALDGREQHIISMMMDDTDRISLA
jgi:hypothetical protein